MTTVLHISDTHFGTEQAPVVAALLALHAQQRPDVVIASGDITQRARPSQFLAAQDFFRKLDTPKVIIPGNHDIPLFNIALRVFAPYRNYARAFGSNLQPDFVSNDLLILGLNTTRPHRHIDGEVSAQQIDYVCERLSNAQAQQLKIIVTHQPVSVTNPADEENLLHGHREAIRAWARAGADLILGGHIHLPYVQPLHATDAVKPLWAVQAGTATSWRIRENAPNSVNIIRYNSAARACHIEQWDYQRQHNAFHPTHHHTLELTAIA